MLPVIVIEFSACHQPFLEELLNELKLEWRPADIPLSNQDHEHIWAIFTEDEKRMLMLSDRLNKTLFENPPLLEFVNVNDFHIQEEAVFWKRYRQEKKSRTVEGGEEGEYDIPAFLRKENR